MRLAYLIHHVSRRAAGVMEVVKAQARTLRALGHTVCIFGYEDPLDPSASGTSWDGLEVSAVPTWGNVAQGYSPTLDRGIVAFKPDIIHTHGIWTGLSLSSLRAHRRTRAPLVISPHGMLDPWALRHRGFKKRLAGWAFERRHLTSAGLVQALTEAEAGDLQLLHLRARIAIIPNGVDEPPTVAPAPPPWAPSDRRRVLLFLGRIHEKKGIFELARTFERLAPTLPDWRLVIAGFGEVDDVQRLEDQLHAARATQFIGRQGPEGRSACYQNATAFVLPSLSEGLPMTVLEAWAHGRPALITPACHLQVGVERGAAWSMTADPPGLEAGLLALCQASDDELKTRGERGRRLALSEFSWLEIGKRLEGEYRQLLGRDGPTPDSDR